MNLRFDSIETEVLLDGEDVTVYIDYTANMYSDGSGAISVEIEKIVNDDDVNIMDQLSPDHIRSLADWIRSKQG